MPKYSREMEAKIIAAFEQGKRNSVISRELRCDRGAIAKLRKEWKKRKLEEEKQETEPENTIQPELNIDPQKYTRVPTNHRAPPSQIIELEKRMSEREESQRGTNPSLDSLLLKRVKELEESQIGSKQSLDKLLLNFEKMRKDPLESVKRKLEKRIRKLERFQQEANPSLLETRISKLEEMRKELLESAERRLTDDDACKHIESNGFCLQYYFPYDDVEKFEYLRPGGRTTYKGKTVYYINVRENPIVCSACPDYESKG